MAMLKPKRIVVLALAVAFVALGAGSALADGPTFPGVRPYNPTMDYVPQNFGIYDTYYEWFKEPDCRSCHGASTAERHHATQLAAQGQCLDCHCDYPTEELVPPVRDCLVCHTDGAEFCGVGEPQGGNYGSPHHRTDESDSRNCVACHDPNLLVETDTVDPPAYDPSNITPTPHACENCHWPTNCAEVLPPRLDPTGSTYDKGSIVTGLPGTCVDDYVNFQLDWSGWPYDNPSPNPANGWPRPSIIDGVGNYPAPIMANGLMSYGTIHADKAFSALTGTHHEVGEGTVLSGNVYGKCYSCHAADPDSPLRTDPYDAEYEYYIRYCENCHDVGTLHDIAEHVTDGPSQGRVLSGDCVDVPLSDKIYTVGGALDQCVTANDKCVACHGDVLAVLPPAPTITPGIDAEVPSFGSPGIIVQLHGSNFGPRLDDDAVQMRIENPPGTGIYVWEAVPIYSWADNLIEFFVPGGSFWPALPESSRVRVLKNVDGSPDLKSAYQAFMVRKHPEIWAISPTAGTWTQKIDITGRGFYTKQEKIYDYLVLNNKAGFGFSTYVELHASNDKYRATVYPKVPNPIPPPNKLAWLPTNIAVKLNIGSLFDIKTGVAVPDPQLYEGSWNMQVVTDYFKDDGDGLYFDKTTGALDIGQVMTPDGLLPLNDPDSPYTEPWNALDGPNGTGTTTYGDGDILLHRERSEPAAFNVLHVPILNKVKPRSGAYKGNTVKAIGYGFGTATGQVEVGNKAFTASKFAIVKSWGTTKVNFKMPGFGVGLVGKKKWVKIHVPGTGASNAKSVEYLGVYP